MNKNTRAKKTKQFVTNYILFQCIAQTLDSKQDSVRPEILEQLDKHPTFAKLDTVRNLIESSVVVESLVEEYMKDKDVFIELMDIFGDLVDEQIQVLTELEQDAAEQASKKIAAWNRVSGNTETAETTEQ